MKNVKINPEKQENLSGMNQNMMNFWLNKAIGNNQWQNLRELSERVTLFRKQKAPAKNWHPAVPPTSKAGRHLEIEQAMSTAR